MKLPFRLIASLFALMLVCSCGCLDLDFVTFVNPTVEPEKAKTQRALYGSYIVSEPSAPKEVDDDLLIPEVEVSSATIVCHIGKAGDGFPDGFLQMARVEIGTDGTMNVDDSEDFFFATKIDDFYVLNIPNPKETDEDFDLIDDLDSIEEPSEKVVEWKPENYEGYTLYVLKPTQEGFNLYSLDEQKLKAEIKAGRLPGDYTTEEEKDEYKKKKRLAKKEGKELEDTRRPFTIKANPRELRAFFEKRLEDVIIHQPVVLLNRVK